MSGRSQNCGRKTSGKKRKIESSTSSDHPADKENKLRATQRYQSVSQDKSSANKLRRPLTDVNDKYTSQVKQRPTTSTTKRSLNHSTSSGTRPLAVVVSGASSTATQQQRSVTSTVVRNRLPVASSSTQLSLRYPYSTINDSEIAFPSVEKMQNVTLRPSAASLATSDDLRSLYSVLSNDEAWLMCKTANEESFVSVPCTENVKHVAPQSSRQAMLKSSPLPDRSKYSQSINDGIPSVQKKTLQREVNKHSECKGTVNIDLVEKWKNVTFRSSSVFCAISDDLDSLDSALSNDDTLFAYQTANEDMFMSVTAEANTPTRSEQTFGEYKGIVNIDPYTTKGVHFD
ncbi:hypothetical protein CBL_08985 [Carabus blaptoides fortunei]